MHSVNPTITDTPSWLLDSGATNHITGDLNNLHLHHPYQGTDQVTVGNGNTLPIHNTGNGPLPTPSHSFQLRNVLHVPGIQSNLLFVHPPPQILKNFDKKCKKRKKDPHNFR